jgi:hypothetical protein
MIQLGLRWYNRLGHPHKKDMMKKVLSSYEYNHEVRTQLILSGLIDCHDEYDKEEDEMIIIQEMKYDIMNRLPWNTPYETRVNMKMILANAKRKYMIRSTYDDADDTSSSSSSLSTSLCFQLPESSSTTKSTRTILKHHTRMNDDAMHHVNRARRTTKVVRFHIDVQ